MRAITTGPGGRPKTETLPPVGRKRPSISRMVVVLPAPFGPRKPKVSPARTEKEALSIPRRRPYRLVSSRASMTTSISGSGRFVPRSGDVLGVPAAIDVRALRSQLQHAVRQLGKEVAVVRDEQEGALEPAQ